jgi:L-seryl-tRNA(Ser) seleniumtransferase
MSKELLRALPSIESLLASPYAMRLSADWNRDCVRDLLREILDEFRQEILSEPDTRRLLSNIGQGQEIYNHDLPAAEDKSPSILRPLDTRDQISEFSAEIERRLASRAAKYFTPSLRRVINATGVILHTNLGRAPLAQAAVQAIMEVAANYSNLEYDLSTGRRGKRESHCQQLLARLLGSQDAIVVNNCAAAVLLVLNTLAEGGEVIVSRGELIEIGGSFRIPEVMQKSGAKLREVGTTNRTRISDYQNAINENTRLILRVHPSNYRIVGFTERPSVQEIAALSQQTGIPSFEDLGSGCLVDLAPLGVKDEPVVCESFKAGISVAAFSGDKMLGGPQAGIIAGEKSVIERVRKNPLMRALRVDKMTYAALEATLTLYERGVAQTAVPVIRAMAMMQEEIEERAEKFKERLHNIANSRLKIVLEEGESVIGGGSAPEIKLPTVLITIEGHELSSAMIEQKLRNHATPIIARTERDRILIDLRTVASSEEETILEALMAIAQPSQTVTASVER